MKITLIGPVYPYRGGISHYTMHLALHLISAGHETQVISFHRQYPAWLYPGESDKDPSKNPLTVPATYVLDPVYPWTWWQAVRAIQSFESQMVVIQWWTTFWAPAFTALSWGLRRKGTQVFFLIHNVLPHEQKPWDRFLTKAALSQANGFITQTHAEKKRLEGLLSSPRVSVCPHPVYSGFQQTQISKSAARTELELPQDKTILLSFGIVRPYKGLHILLDAVGIFAQSRKDIFLVIAGEFWDDKQKYLSQIEQLEIGDLVRIEDRYLPDDEVSLFFSASDILVAPYTGGTQSGAVNLGIGYGIPAIVSENVANGIPAANRHLITVTPTGNAEALRAAIESSLTKRRDHDLPDQGYQHGWDDLITTLLDCYQP